MSDKYSYCQSDYLLPNILLQVWQQQYKRLYKIKKRNHLQKQRGNVPYTQETCFNGSGFEDLGLEGPHTSMPIEMVATPENMEVFVFI